MCTETAASVLVNGVDLFRLDLQGVVSLVPSVLGVLESVLPEGELTTPLQLSVTLLRRAATHILLSILPLPLHFQVSNWRKLSNLAINPYFSSYFVSVDISNLLNCILFFSILQDM